MRIEIETEVPLSVDPAEGLSRLREHLARNRYRLEPGASVRAARGSAFSLHPAGFSHAVEARAEGGEGGHLRIRLSARALPWRKEAHRLALERLAAELRAAAGGPAGEAGPRGSRPAAGRILLAGLLAGFLAFWLAGHHLLVRDLDAIRAGTLAWDYHPEPEPLTNLAPSVPWTAAAFLGGTAGFAAGAFLAVLLWISSRALSLAEATGGILAWSSALLVVALATGPGPSGIGLARSMLDPWVLLPVLAFPWAAHLLATCPSPRAAESAPKGAAALLALALLAPAPSRAEEPPDAGLDASLRTLYETHRFRDRYLLTNPVGGFWCALYYRYTPYADLAASERLHPDRTTLRLLRDAGVALWLYGVTTAGVGLLAWSLARRAWRLAAAGRWGACAGLLSVPLLLAGWLLRLVLGAAEIPLSTDPPAIATMLAHGTDAERSEAAHALAAVGTPAEIPALRGALADPDPRVRLWAVTALARLGDLASLPEILERLDDPHDLVRSRVYHALPYLARAARERGAADPEGIRRVLSRLEPKIAAERSIYFRKQALEARRAWRALLQ